MCILRRYRGVKSPEGCHIGDCLTVCLWPVKIENLEWAPKSVACTCLHLNNQHVVSEALLSLSKSMKYSLGPRLKHHGGEITYFLDSVQNVFSAPSTNRNNLNDKYLVWMTQRSTGWTTDPNTKGWTPEPLGRLYEHNYFSYERTSPNKSKSSESNTFVWATQRITDRATDPKTMGGLMNPLCFYVKYSRFLIKKIFLNKPKYSVTQIKRTQSPVFCVIWWWSFAPPPPHHHRSHTFRSDKDMKS